MKFFRFVAVAGAGAGTGADVAKMAKPEAGTAKKGPHSAKLWDKSQTYPVASVPAAILRKIGFLLFLCGDSAFV